MVSVEIQAKELIMEARRRGNGTIHEILRFCTNRRVLGVELETAILHQLGLLE